MFIKHYIAKFAVELPELDHPVIVLNFNREA